MEWWMWALVAGIALLLVLVVVVPRQRRSRLQSQFGPEYDRALERSDSQREAEHDLRGRLKAHRNLELRPLSPREAAEYSRRWFVVQSQFVDAPDAACRDAGELLDRVLRDRGYPVDEDFDTQADLVSVDHPNLVNDYRTAHEATRRGHADPSSTEHLRVAFVAYRNLFSDVLDEQDEARESVEIDRDGEPDVDRGHGEPTTDEEGDDEDGVIDLTTGERESPVEDASRPPIDAPVERHS